MSAETTAGLYRKYPKNKPISLRSRRLEVAGERENGRAQGRHARGEGSLHGRPPKIVSTRTL